MRITTLALALGLVAASAVAQEAPTGTWIAVSAERDGAAAPDTVGHRLRLEGEGFTILGTDGATVYRGAVEFDAAAKPATVDFDNATGDAAGTVWAGIWQLVGDTLTVVDNAPDPSRPRPTAFSAPAGSGHIMVVFRRYE